MPEMDQEQKAPEVAESNVKPGGLSFEVNILRCCAIYLNSIVIVIKVVLEDAKTSDKPAITASPESPSLTAEELEKKLQEVEDRRKSLEAATLERLAEAEKRAEEVIQNLYFGNKRIFTICMYLC